ncbi:coronin 7 [Homo sapiens]|uniref:Coronin 7 n=1 Tax=Homo sapiens TaxID=9606 RepID=I3L359_HUMAN|nr:coronin 7 [Homo sapiens]KAI4053286.1 coronin 7 [Homo sapiens]
MNRFRVSKFRHTEARPPRRESWISDIRAGTAPSCRNHIKSSCSLIAFNSDRPGVLGIVPLQGQGEDKRRVAHLGCHSELAAHGDLVQSAVWSRDGALVGTACKTESQSVSQAGV